MEGKNTNSRNQTSNNADVIPAMFFNKKGLSFSLFFFNQDLNLAIEPIISCKMFTEVVNKVK